MEKHLFAYGGRSPMPKHSIRFFDNREVRANWSDEVFKWYFSVLNIIAVLHDQDDYT